MPYTRRKILGIIGGGSIVAAGGGAGVYLSTRTPTKALAPWTLAGGYQEPRRRALSYAILAPNPHNRQPWLVDLATDNKIVLHVDTDKLLPHTDPYNRQITIGLGCFLELLQMAAAEDGYRASINPFPQGFDNAKLDKRPVAEITFVKDSNLNADPLFKHVLARRSLKEAFDLENHVPDAILAKISTTPRNGSAMNTTNDMAMVNELRALTHAAMAVELATPRTYKESVDLFRIGKSEVNANPDGIDFTGPMFDTLGKLGMFTREMATDTSTSVYRQGIDAVMISIDTAMGYTWLMSEGNTRLDQINAGRDWLRLNLHTTGVGIGLHPISQALQEYDEMKPHFAKLQSVLGTSGKTIQMLGRLGYAANTPPSPRWPLDAKIMKG